MRVPDWVPNLNYEEALAWLYIQTRGGAPRSLERARRVLGALGQPQQGIEIFHIIGTNGKGSVAAYLRSVLALWGIPFGSFTSPHVVDFRERIVTHQGLISTSEIIQFVRWAQAQPSLPAPAFFDWVLGMACWHFGKLRVRTAVVEAGVGGVGDATAALGDVRITVLTNVDEDHLQTLGGSLASVAREKAGAVRRGVPVVTAARGVGLDTVRAVAGVQCAPVYVLDESNPLFALEVMPGIPGPIQETNARLAAAALRLFGVPEKVLSLGIARARLVGRMQHMCRWGVELVLDGAHNPPAAAVLRRSLPRYHLVFGAFPRKDVRSVLRWLLPGAESVVFTSAGEGALDAAAFRSLLHRALYVTDPLEALMQAVARAKKRNEPVLVTGSFYLVGAVLRRLEY